MTRLKLGLLPAVAMLAIASPAAAQMDHSKMPGMKMPAPAPTTAAKKPAVKKPAATTPAPKKPAAKKSSATRPAAKQPAARPQPAAAMPPGHDMSAMPAQPVPATAMPPGHDMSTMPAQPVPATAMPPGHDMSAMPAQPAPATTMPPGHDMSAMPAMPGMAPPAGAAGTDLPAGTAPVPPVPTANAADTFFGTEAMEVARHHLKEFHGGQKLFQALFNIAEYQSTKGRDGFGWDGEAWYGGDTERLWVKSAGEGSFGERLESAEAQALYSYAIGPYFWVQGGLRYDFEPDPSRVYATVALEGLAPSFFDVEAALFLSNKGELMARAEGWYDQRITQRLILQPRAELNFAAQNSPSIGVGGGLSSAEAGLRLRYDIRREFAPYIGVQYERAFGRTRDYLRAAGGNPGGWSLLAGIRTWF